MGAKLGAAAYDKFVVVDFCAGSDDPIMHFLTGAGHGSEGSSGGTPNRFSISSKILYAGMMYAMDELTSPAIT